MVDFETLYAEARNNFDVGRYEEAAKLFEQLVRICVKENKMIDLLYFTYRAGLAWTFAGKQEELISLYYHNSLITTKYSSKLAYQQRGKCTSILDRIIYTKHIFKNMQLLKKEEASNKIKAELRDELVKAISHVSDFIVKKDLIDQLLSLMGEDDEKSKYIKIKAELLEHEGDFQLHNSSFDPEIIAEKLYSKAINYYTEINAQRRIKRLKRKIQQLSLTTNENVNLRII